MGNGVLSIVNGRPNPIPLDMAKRDEEWYGTVCVCSMDGAMPCGVVWCVAKPNPLGLARSSISEGDEPQDTAATLLCSYSPPDLARRMERDGIVSAPLNGLGPIVDARLSGRCVGRRALRRAVGSRGAR